MKHATFATALFVVTTAMSTTSARAQPGATPPGSTPPYSEPPYSEPPYSEPPYSEPYGEPPANDAPPSYYGEPMPPPPLRPTGRVGWNFGVSAGVGEMNSSANGGFACAGCEVDPPAGSFDVHVGSMITRQLAIQGELWFQTRALDVDGIARVSQSMLLIAAQYWLTPRLWLKAGVGIASLSVSYFDGYQDRNENIGQGGGFMGAIGYELMHSQGFGLDIQLKTGVGGYEEDSGEEVSTTAIALGLNWY